MPYCGKRFQSAHAWLAQRLHRVPTGKQQFVDWNCLQDQFGQGFARIRDFRRKFLRTLHQVAAAYPTARLTADDHGMTLSNSPPPGRTTIVQSETLAPS